VPKALLPVAGRPFLAWQLELLASGGVHEIVFAVGHRGRQIEDFVGNGSRWGLSVSYSYEQEGLLGTAGAVRLAVDRGMMQGSFFVLYGDSYLPVCYREVAKAFASSPHPAMMTVYPNHDRWEQSNAIYVDGMIKLYTKGGHFGDPEFTHIDYGLSVLRPEVATDYIPVAQAHDLADTFHVLSVAGRLAGYVAPHRYYEIGSPSGRDALEMYLSSGGQGGGHV
jgi:NDP-sugar pyrophosphorylase family protein